MKYYYFDHLSTNAEQVRLTFPALADFAGFFGASYCDSPDKMPGSDAVAFVHAGNLRTEWEATAKPGNHQWIVFVSKGGPAGLNSATPGVRCITQDLMRVVDRLTSNSPLVEKFKKSCCESTDGPNVGLLMGCWPEHVLSSYLFAVSSNESDINNVAARLHVDYTDIKNEYVQYCRDHGLESSGTLTVEKLKELLNKIANSHAR